MIIRRYLSVTLWRSIGLFLLVLLCIVFLFDCLQYFARMSDHASILSTFLFVCCLLPAHLYDLTPMGIFMGAFHAFSGFAQRSELVIMRTLGLSPLHMFRHIGLLCCVLMLFTYAVGEYLVPIGLEAAVVLKGQKALSFFGAGSGVWLKEANYFLTVQSIDRDEVLRGIRGYGFDHYPDWQFIKADHAVFDVRKSQWVCVDVDLLIHDAHGLHHRHQAYWLSPFRFSPYTVTAMLMPLRYMGIRNAFVLQQHGRHNDTSTYMSENALWRQLAYPFFIPVLLFFAIAMSYKGHYRASGRGMNIVIGFFMSMVLYAVSNIVMSLALLEKWPVGVAVFGPLCFFSLLAVVYAQYHEA